MFGESCRLPLLANTLPISPTNTDSAIVGQSPPLLNCVHTSVEVALSGHICLLSARFAALSLFVGRTHIDHRDQKGEEAKDMDS